MLAIEYALNFNKVLHIKVTLNPCSIFAILLLIMIAHGTIIGVSNHNPPFTILNDIVPLLMIFLNILRIQSVSETHYINMERVLKFCAIVVLFDTAFSILLYQQIPGLWLLYMVVLVAFILANKPLRWFHYLLVLIPAVLSINEINRTTMLFILISSACIFVKATLYSPRKGAGFLVGLLIAISIAVVAIPKDSKTYERIAGLQHIDLSKRTGSLGERQQEWESINTALQSRGTTDQWSGLGMGGTFTMHFTHETVENYGHAHYSWAWFKLRFGNVGFIYLAIMVIVLMLNTMEGFIVGKTSKNPLGYMIALLGIFSLLYCLTYVNWIFLLSGLQFLALKSKAVVLAEARTHPSKT